jgi:hypothetical protein
MKYKLGNLLLGELTNGMFISLGGYPFLKESLLYNSEETLKPYSGSESIELTDKEFNRLTAEYFAHARKPSEFMGVSSS